MASPPSTHRLDELAIDARMISPLVIVTGGLIVADLLRHTLYSHSPLLTYGLVGVMTIFALSHYIPRLKFRELHTFYLIAYHVLFGLAVVLIVPTLSYYLFLWILLLYLSEYYYQAKGMILSLLTLVFIILAGVLHQSGGVVLATLIDSLPRFIIIVATTFVLTRLVLGGRKERLDLTNKVVDSEYEHERLVALINSMTEAVVATDQDGVITMYNAAALDLLDTNMELTGKKISEKLHLVDAEKKPVDIMEVARQTRYIAHRNDLISILPEMDQMALDINISRVSMVASIVKQEGFTFLMRDITQQKSFDEERDLFISEVSHELRTPITIAEANVSMASLQAGKDPFDKMAVLQNIDKAHKQVLFLADMVNDLSTLSRAQRDDKDMDVATFSISEIITELARTYAPQAAKKSLFLQTTIDEDLPQITTSRLYLKEILQNFVTNAIKYTKEGGITVEAHKHDGHTIELTVHDTGIGITKTEITKVFEKFWRSENPYTRATSGTGLGLFITAKLARRIGAEITLKSQLGSGSTFGLRLPVLAVKKIDQKNVVHNEVAHLLE